MKIIAIIFLLGHIGFSSLYASNEWEYRFSIQGVPKGIECLDNNNCFVSSTTGLSNWLYKTTNQGRNWQLIWETQTHIGVQSNSALSVSDSQNIFLLFSVGGLLKSSDGGYNFEFKPSLSGTIISMLNENIGFIGPYGYITYDGWETYEFLYYKFQEELDMSPSFQNLKFINDTTLLIILRNSSAYYLLKLNIYNLKYNYHFIDDFDEGIRDLCIVNDNLIFVCGKSNTLSGGSGHDAIYKSTDAGKTWRRVLDLYNDNKLGNMRKPFGLQSIAFKDSLTGIAVGQFGKILYTYDGGESWNYETNLPVKLGGGESNPATMIVRYAGTQPIIVDFNGAVHTLKKDNLAPKADDTLTISGYVYDGMVGQQGIPISLNNSRITMTDENGKYIFTNLPPGQYTVKALNKYFDGPNESYYYKPFTYFPEKYEFNLTENIYYRNFLAIFNQIKYNVDVMVSYLDEKFGAEVIRVNDDIKPINIYNNRQRFFLEPGHYRINIFHNPYIFDPEYIDLDVIGDTTVYFVGQFATDVKDTEKPVTISYYINNDRLYINTELNTNNLVIKIYDILGKQLLNTALQSEHNISYIPNGLYFVAILNGSNLVQRFKVYVSR